MTKYTLSTVDCARALCRGELSVSVVKGITSLGVIKNEKALS